MFIQLNSIKKIPDLIYLCQYILIQEGQILYEILIKICFVHSKELA
jgi:hypothetical protein